MKRALVPLVLGFLVALVAAFVPTAAVADGHSAALSSIQGGATQDTYSYANAIRQSVWVDTGLTASGQPGGHVRVAADIIRPGELDGTAKVPVIMDASPYFSCCGRGNELQVKQYDSAGNPTSFPLFYDNYFVPRGYAVVLVDLAGTNRSQGCVDTGGPADVTSAKAVIDWLNGRATGYTSSTGSTAASAYWASGSVGMIGKSWDGTIAEGVAATGVAGLDTIVPISAISSWYNYFRADGAPLDRETPGELATEVESSSTVSACASVASGIDAGSPSNGNYTSMYAQRNYAANAGNVKASVFMTHGVNDYNVMTIDFGQWWSALPASVPKMIWLSQTGHVDPFDYRRSAWVDELHRWFDHYLMGIDNGVQGDPQASVERAPDQWVDYPTWPVPGTTPTTWHLRPGSTAGVGTLGAPTAPAGSTAAFTDNPNQDDDNWAATPTSTASDRIIYSTGPLTAATTISGTTTVTLTVTPSTSAARLSAVLVDYGSTTMRDYQDTDAGITTLTTRSCWGDSTAADSACYLDTVPDTTTVSDDVFERGWADLGHYKSLTSQQTLKPGTAYPITFQLNTTDHTVPAGHTLALIIGGTDAGYIDGPAGKPKLTVNLAASSVQLPLSTG
ncbi:MAG TPA: Xaa-Pro dipeptidyl-peptidase [Pseudonocardiaceae bacterium]|jgi:X-Pro dipeptidyl-peptidase|nr:Xaa-Pro dipeptidyl-peptidase [Pseudonocardiaceae bacterium]